MAGINIPNIALIGAFAQSRKQAKQREMQVIEKMYNMQQAKMQQQLKYDTQMNNIMLQSNKSASAIAYGGGRADVLSGFLNETISDMKREARENYNGNVSKYMLEVGNDKLFSAVQQFDTQIADISKNSEQIAKYIQATQDPKNSKNLIDQSKELNDYNSGKVDRFIYKGLLTEIDDTWVENVEPGQRANANDILVKGNNRDIIASNFVREYGYSPTENQLSTYAYETYIGSQNPTTLGTKKIKTNVGTNMLDNLAEDNIATDTLNPAILLEQFNNNNLDNFFNEVYAGANAIHDTTGRTKIKPKRKINANVELFDPGNGGHIFESYNAAIQERYGNFKDIDSTKLYKGENGKKINSSEFKSVLGFERGEGTGAEPRRYQDQLQFQGVRRALKYTLNGQDFLLTKHDDPKKTKAVLEQLAESEVSPDLQTVYVAELVDKDRGPDEIRYMEIDMSTANLGRISNTKAGKEADITDTQNLIADRQKSKALRKDYSEKYKTSSVNLQNTLNIDQRGVEALLQNSQNELIPILDKSKVDRSLMVPLMSYAIAISDNARDALDYMNSLDMIINFPQTQQHKEFSKALKAGRVSGMNYINSLFTNVTDADEYRSIQNNYSTFVTASRNI